MNELAEAVAKANELLNLLSGEWTPQDAYEKLVYIRDKIGECQPQFLYEDQNVTSTSPTDITLQGWSNEENPDSATAFAEWVISLQ